MSRPTSQRQIDWDVPIKATRVCSIIRHALQHTYTHVLANPWEGGRGERGKGRAGSPDISRVRKWVGLEHEFICFLPTSGIKGDWSHRTAQLEQAAAEPRKRTAELPPPAGRSQPQLSNSQQAGRRVHHRAPWKTPGRKKASSFLRPNYVKKVTFPSRKAVTLILPPFLFHPVLELRSLQPTQDRRWSRKMVKLHF